VLSIPLTYLASELGWVLAEVGRQPWIIQDLMSVSGAVSQIVTGSVITTFILFAVLFTLLLVADISILLKQIKTGPKH
jgi:cytochrome d ubiquinol oxidase subunit I